jgi:hypothetical protein
MIASNRKNARKSCGPKTIEGKNIVRRNALKHGLTAKTLVVLGECEDNFQAMADAHLAVFQPRNEVELEFCKTFTLAAWRRQRCVSAEVGVTNEHIRATQLDEETTARNAALALGERLFHRVGFWQSYLDPLAKYRPNYRDHFGPPGPVEAAAQLVAELESTLEGCRFLLEHWRELKMRLNCERGWKPFEMFMCMRLTGREPLDVLDEPPGELMDIFLACRKIDGSDRVPFKELRLCVGHDIEFEIIFERLQGMGYEARTPASEDHARSILDNLVDRYTCRIEELFRAYQERSLLEATERARRLIFDPGDGAEKARRYGDICVRQMTLACEELIKIRRSGFADEDGGWQPLAANQLEVPGSIPAEVGLTASSSVQADDFASKTEFPILTAGTHGSPASIRAKFRKGEPPCEPRLGQECGSDGALPSRVTTRGGHREGEPPCEPHFGQERGSEPAKTDRGGSPSRVTTYSTQRGDQPPCEPRLGQECGSDPPQADRGGSSRDYALRFGALGYALLLLLGLWRSLLGAGAARMRVAESPLLTAQTALLRLVQAFSTRLAVAQNKPVAICADRAGAIQSLMMASPP